MIETVESSSNQISGTITHLFTASPNFSAGVISLDKYDTARFRACFMLREQDRVVLRGKWTNDKTYGRQFAADSLEYDVKLSAGGLAQYLANHPAISGIGPVKAKRIANAFGEDFARVLREEPEKVRQIAKINQESLDNLVKIWGEAETHNAVATILSEAGLTFNQIKTLIQKYGNSIKSILDEDPYLLISDLKGYGFRKIDEIARKLGVPKNHPGRVKTGVLFAVNEALFDRGHTYCERQELIKAANDLLIMDTLDSRERISNALDELIRSGQLIEYAGEQARYISRRDAFAAENMLGSILIDVATHKRSSDIEDAAITEACPSLNTRQRQAVSMAFAYPVSLISGGAGVGKTYTIEAIVSVADKHGLSIELAAPTGKAAKRIEQVVRREARTIHRLLEYHPLEGFRRNEENPLEADLVILDEFSMVDVFLARNLFKAIDLDHTSVILVGDHNQLPPVGPGNLLRDIINRKLTPMTILDEVVRQAGILKENCTSILHGIVKPTAPGQSGTLRPWYLINGLKEPQMLKNALLELIEQRLEPLGFDLLDDIQVLAPQKKGPIGVEQLNIELQKLIQKKLYKRNIPEPKPGRRLLMYEGDKVIQTRNDYELGVMNGEIGRISNISKKKVIKVLFENGVEAEYEPGDDKLKNLTLAYCLTIHKSQGAEFPCVIAIIQKYHSFMHDRCLFYTAVTRARQCAIVLGDHWGIRHCAETVKSTKRNTILSLEDFKPVALTDNSID